MWKSTADCNKLTCRRKKLIIAIKPKSFYKVLTTSTTQNTAINLTRYES